MVSETPTLADVIKQRAHALGFELVGVCLAQTAPHLSEYERWLGKGYHASMDYLLRQISLKRHPEELLPGCRSVIAVGLNYNQPNPHVPGEALIARYALGRDYHKVMRGKLKALAASLKVLHPEAEFRPCVDSAPIYERDFANLAGLGWFGKNTMLINSERGSWFFLGLLLTTLDLEPDKPAVGGCGMCTRCIQACPTGAIVFEEGRWQVDGRRCISYLTIEHDGAIDKDLASAMGEWTFGCDVCQEVCPFNESRASQPLRAQETKEPDFLNRKRWPNLEQLTMIDGQEWDEKTAGSPLRRTGLEGLKRNARINLANLQLPF